MDVSVIMPIRGGAPFLREALASIEMQSLPVGELLVVDDGMEEPARAMLEATAVPHRVLQGPSSGPAAARNVALAEARGDLIAFLDDDDIWPADKLQRQLGWLDRHPDDLAVGGRIVWFSQWDDERGIPKETPDLQSVVHVNLGAYIYRRSLFDTYGMLDADLMFSEDVDLILRMLDNEVGFSVIDHPTLYYRRHPASMTAQRSERERQDFSRVLFRSVGSRRGKPGNLVGSLGDRLVSEDEPDDV